MADENFIVSKGVEKLDVPLGLIASEEEGKLKLKLMFNLVSV